MAKTNTTLFVAIGVVVVLAVALVLIYALPSAPAVTTTTVATTVAATSTAVTSATTTVKANASTATASNFADCNGFNMSLSSSGNTTSRECSWRGGLLQVALYGGNFNSVGVHFNQINTTNSTTPFASNYYVNSCGSNSTAQYVPLGEYRIAFTTGPLGKAGINCGSATLRLSKT